MFAWIGRNRHFPLGMFARIGLGDEAERVGGAYPVPRYGMLWDTMAVIKKNAARNNQGGEGGRGS